MTTKTKPQEIAKRTVRRAEPPIFGEHGHRIAYPVIAPQFKSRMHSVRNLELGSGLADGEVVERVLARTKPVGFADTWERDEAVSWAQRCLACDSPFEYAEGYGDYARNWSVHVAASPKAISDVINVPAAIRDYRTWFGQVDREIADDIEVCLTHLTSFALPHFLHFPNVEPWYWDHDSPTPGERAWCGILLGYPLWATAAWIGNAERVDGFAYLEF